MILAPTLAKQLTAAEGKLKIGRFLRLRPTGLALRVLHLKSEISNWTRLSVGAVYDRAYYIDLRKKRAIIDGAYRELTGHTSRSGIATQNTFRKVRLMRVVPVS